MKIILSMEEKWILRQVSLYLMQSILCMGQDKTNILCEFVWITNLYKID